MRPPHRILAAAALLVLLCPRSGAAAMCPFQHPASAKRMTASLTQAFVDCGGFFSGPVPNAETQTHIPSCYPAQTWNEKAGSPPGGWVYGPKGYGSITMKVHEGDVAVTLKLGGLLEVGSPAAGVGKLQMLVRMTVADPAGPMTVIDFPFNWPIIVANGKGQLKTTINTFFSQLPGGPYALPPCSNLELVSLQVLDPEVSPFASLGVFLP